MSDTIVAPGWAIYAPLGSFVLGQSALGVESAARFAQADYQSAILALMPRGYAWNRDPGSTQALLAYGLAGAFYRTDEAAQALLLDAWPGTTVNLLSAWQQTLGLPDPCVSGMQTIDQQQIAVVAKFVANYSPTVANVVAFAAALGFPVNVQEFRPMRFGDSFGDAMRGPAWAYAFELTPQPGCPAFSTGLTCAISRIAPARTYPILNG
jgi:uncharacterized protein YmfQ (DUF2313 family)